LCVCLDKLVQLGDVLVVQPLERLHLELDAAQVVLGKRNRRGCC
jgi:hypothetical protein